MCSSSVGKLTSRRHDVKYDTLVSTNFAGNNKGNNSVMEFQRLWVENSDP